MGVWSTSNNVKQIIINLNDTSSYIVYNFKKVSGIERWIRRRSILRLIQALLNSPKWERDFGGGALIFTRKEQ